MPKTIPFLSDYEVDILTRGREDPDVFTNYWFRQAGAKTGWNLDENFDPESAWQKTVHFAKQEFIKLAGAAAEGVIGSSPGLPLEKMPGGKDLGNRFKERYGKVQIYAPFAYDATQVLAGAMLKADSADPAKYIPVLAGYHADGVIGPIAFDERGDLKDGPVTLYQVKYGSWEPIEILGGTHKHHH